MQRAILVKLKETVSEADGEQVHPKDNVQYAVKKMTSRISGKKTLGSKTAHLYRLLSAKHKGNPVKAPAQNPTSNHDV